jgi:uncharacterized membrane protein
MLAGHDHPQSPRPILPGLNVDYSEDLMLAVSANSLSRYAILVSLLLCIGGTGRAQLSGITPFGGFGTTPLSIDASGQVTGIWTATEHGTVYGFLRKMDGTMEAILFPRSYETFAVGSNPAGQVIGDDWPCENCLREGFTYDSTSGYTPLLVSDDAISVLPSGINTAGEIVGGYEDARYRWHGFLRDGDGTITDLVCKGEMTLPSSINTAGQIAGSYIGPDGTTHGFVKEANGVCESFDLPASLQIYPAQINDSGDVAGYYVDSTQLQHGFLLKRGRPVVVFDPSGSIDTIVTGISDSGVVVGSFVLAGTDTIEGFIRDPDGAMTEIDLLGSGNTELYAINQIGLVAGASSALDSAFLFRAPPKQH